MSDLAELYQEVVLDHSRHPHNYGRLEHPTRAAQGVNPLCGDKLRVEVQVADGRVEDIRFVGDGCAISRASASLMTEAVKGRTLDEAKALFAKMHTMLTDGEAAKCPAEELGTLCALSGVWEYPSRVKCASLAWHTLRQALDEETSK